MLIVSGTVVKTIEYDTFGFILNDTNSSFTVPFGFAGGLHDRDTGLVRFGYRDYDPEVGRWTAKDPIFFNGGDTDLYGYVLDDPVNLIDPMGLEAFKDLLKGYQDKDEVIAKMDWSKNNAWIYDKIEKGGSCGARLSNAFNNAGSDFTKNANVRKFTDKNGNTYILGAGEVARAQGMDSQKYRIKNLESIKGKTGIIYYENTHIDLWNGEKMRGNGYADYNVPKYFKEIK